MSTICWKILTKIIIIIIPSKRVNNKHAKVGFLTEKKRNANYVEAEVDIPSQLSFLGTVLNFCVPKLQKKPIFKCSLMKILNLIVN